MKTPLFLPCLSVSLLSFFAVPAAWSQGSKADSAAIEKALRDLDAKCAAAAGAKNVEQVASFYAENALVMPPNAPSATTKAAIRKEWETLLKTPGLTISWKPTRVEVAQSGDLASTTGTYELAINDPSSKPVKDAGKYLAVWKTQADGTWKIVLDMWNSDLPASASGEKE